MLAKFRDYIEQFVFMRSLRARLFVIILLVGIIPSVLIRYAILDNYEERAVELRQSTVQNQLRILADHLTSKNYLENYQLNDQQSAVTKEVINAELEMLSNLYDG